MANKTLSVVLTQAQYDRYKAAFQALQQTPEPPTDEELVAQLKREASAITYAAEVSAVGGTGDGWTY